jgi:hypothetical protein
LAQWPRPWAVGHRFGFTVPLMVQIHAMAQAPRWAVTPLELANHGGAVDDCLGRAGG